MGVSPLQPSVSSTEDQPEGRQALLSALRVRRNALLGVAVGTLFTLGVFLLFVIAPAATVRSPLYYLALGFVLALTTSGLATAVLVAVRAYRLSKEL
jgi:hypothetical protein